MFTRQRRFGQWEWATTLTTTEYRPISEQVSSSGASVSTGILPVLQNLISSVGQVGSAYFGMQAVKEKAKVLPTTIKPAVTPVTPKVAGIDLGSLPILGIIAIGAFLILRSPKRKRGKR